MPNGSTASSGDIAPSQSPVLFTDFDLTAGDWLMFNVVGQVGNCSGCESPTPDGSSGMSGIYGHSNENGIAAVTAPLNALMGVFLDDTQPDQSAAPAGLDFSVIGLDFDTLAPQLKQVFFIGDGVGSNGIQHFLVPVGATRLFLGTMDGYGWYNNVGEFSANVSAVPEPESYAMFLVGLGLVGAMVNRRRNLSK